MALLRKYICKQCSYTVVASANPYVVTASELYAQCYCSHCQKITKVSAGDTYQVDITRLQLMCDTCDGKVSIWTPDMGCPHCGGAMILSRDDLFEI